MRPVIRSRISGDVLAFMGVAMTAGAMTFTRTPLVASSLPRDLVIAITAALDAEYAESPAFPSLPAMLATLTMRPQPRSIMPGAKARHRWKLPVTLTDIVAAHSASSTSHSGLFGPTIPAQLTRMSIGPM